MLGLSLCLIESERLLIKGHTLNLAESRTQIDLLNHLLQGCGLRIFIIAKFPHVALMHVQIYNQTIDLVMGIYLSWVLQKNFLTCWTHFNSSSHSENLTFSMKNPNKPFSQIPLLLRYESVTGSTIQIHLCETQKLPGHWEFIFASTSDSRGSMFLGCQWCCSWQIKAEAVFFWGLFCCSGQQLSHQESSAVWF